MKKILKDSLIEAEISAFIIFIILFFINTDKPFLLFAPIVLGLAGFIGFNVILRKLQVKESKVTNLMIIGLPIVLGIIISVIISGLIYLL